MTVEQIRWVNAVSVLAAHGVRVLTVAEPLGAAPTELVGSGEDELAFLQLTSGSTGCVKAVATTHANVISTAEARFVGARYDINTDVIASSLLPFYDMGMTGFLPMPMPMPFGGQSSRPQRSTLWPISCCGPS